MSGSTTHIDQFILIARGDERAFQHVFRYYTPRLHQFILKIVKKESVAEGVVQHVFLKLWEHREEVALKDNPSSWLFTVAAHLSFNYLKRMSVQQRYIDFVKRAMAEGGNREEVEGIIAFKESRGILYKAIEQLPPQRQNIFKLSRMEGLSHKEIAARLQISPLTVKNQLVAALDYLRKEMKKINTLFIVLLLHANGQFF